MIAKADNGEGAHQNYSSLNSRQRLNDNLYPGAQIRPELPYDKKQPVILIYRLSNGKLGIVRPKDEYGGDLVDRLHKTEPESPERQAILLELAAACRPLVEVYQGRKKLKRHERGAFRRMGHYLIRRKKG